MTMAADETLRKSRIDPSSIDVVLRTGGSSLIPAVKHILDQKFPVRLLTTIRLRALPEVWLLLTMRAVF